MFTLFTINHMDILCHPDLLSELVDGEILPHCTLSALAWVGRVSKRWAQRVKVLLDRALFHNMELCVFPGETDQGVIPMQWRGKYSAGCLKACVRYPRNMVYLVSLQGALLSFIKFMDYAPESFPNSFPYYPCCLIFECGEKHTIVTGVGVSQHENYGFFMQAGRLDRADFDLLQLFVSEQFPGVVVTVDTAHMDQLLFLHDYPAFCEELARVKEIARRRGLEFYW